MGFRILLTAVATLVLNSASLVRPAGAEEPQREMRLFDVRFLTQEPASGTARVPRPSLRSAAFDRLYGVAEIVLEADEAASSRVSRDTVVGVIRELIAEDSWSNQRNVLTTSGHRLVVVQTPDVLSQIGDFLTGLEVRAGRLVALELALVPPEALEEVVPGWRDPRASPWLDGGVIERAARVAGKRGAFLSATAREAAWTRFEPCDVGARIFDYDVNQTGVVPVVCPVVWPLRRGVYADARPLVAPGGDWFGVDLRLGRVAPRGEPKRRRIPYGDLDLERREQHEIATTVIAPRGRTVVLGYFSVNGLGEERAGLASFVGLLRVRPLTAGVPPRLQEKVPVALDAGLLVAALRESSLVSVTSTHRAIHFGKAAQAEEEERPEGLMDPDRLEDMLHAAFPDEDAGAWRLELEQGALFLRGSEARDVRAYLERLARERARLVQVDLWQGTVETEELAGARAAGALLGGDWLGKIAARPGVRARLVGLGARRVSLASVLTRDYVADVEKVSGGTGWKVTEVVDPIVAHVGQGLVVDIQCDLVPGTGWAQLHVSGEFARPPSFERHAKTRMSSEVEVERRDKKAGLEPVAEWLRLDLPDEDSDRWQHLVTVPLGKPILLNLLPDPSSPGKSRVLTATVHEYGMETAADENEERSQKRF